MNKESIGKKYIVKYVLYVSIVGLIGSGMVVNSSIGGFLTDDSNGEALKSLNNHLVISAEETEKTQKGEESIKDDIVEEVAVHEEGKRDKEVETVKAVEKEEVKKVFKEESVKDIKKGGEEVKKALSEEVRVDSSPITTDQYVVKANDSLFYISQRSKVSMDTLKSLNNIDGDKIFIGQVLEIKSNVNTNSNRSNSVVATRGEREEDLYWLSRIIHAEAQGEPYEGKLAVGNVILNRVKSHLFPNTIKGVVFDKQQGYTQFSPVIDGTIYNNPGDESIKAAKAVLNGARPVGDALYFLNPSKSTNFWIVKNRVYYKTIGDHDFYY